MGPTRRPVRPRIRVSNGTGYFCSEHGDGPCLDEVLFPSAGAGSALVKLRYAGGTPNADMDLLQLNVNGEDAVLDAAA